MCQAIVKPAGISIDKELLEQAWRDNPDGAGIAYRTLKGQVKTTKGFFDYEDFLAFYEGYSHLDMLIHFRYATHGSIRVENCHPFALAPNVALAHNGILSKHLPVKGDDRSDTRVFVEDFLIPKLSGSDTHKELQQVSLMQEIYSEIGSSKLAVLTPRGFLFYNESLGEWDNGVWWSAGKPMLWNNLYSYEDEESELSCVLCGEIGWCRCVPWRGRKQGKWASWGNY